MTGMTADRGTLERETSPLVRLRGLAKSFGAVDAVRPLDLDIFPGDFFAILGPSGCGKTTLLRMIGGFIEPLADDPPDAHRTARGIRISRAPVSPALRLARCAAEAVAA